MARYALILPNWTVESVIVADQSFLDTAPQAWRDRYMRIVEAAASAEPLAGYDPDTGTFVRPEAGKQWDPVAKRMVVDPAYVAPPPTIEERVAALERTPPPEGATLEERIAALERTR